MMPSPQSSSGLYNNADNFDEEDDYLMDNNDDNINEDSDKEEERSGGDFTLAQTESSGMDLSQFDKDIIFSGLKRLYRKKYVRWNYLRNMVTSILFH